MQLRAAKTRAVGNEPPTQAFADRRVTLEPWGGPLLCFATATDSVPTVAEKGEEAGRRKKERDEASEVQ